jgi:hypothetical protein
MHLAVLLRAAARRRPAAAAAAASFASQPASALKARLRDLYKRVHPDLFAAHPEAAARNSHSLKLLHEYVEAARGGGGGVGRTAGVPYRFEFFLRAAAAAPSGAADVEADSDAEDAPEVPLEHVALTLPPPPAGATGEEVAPDARKALGRLLVACGVHAGLGDGGNGAADAGLRYSLRRFVPASAEAVHAAAAARGGPRAELAAARAALLLSRGAAAAFGGAATRAGTLERVAALRQLLAVLQEGAAARLDLSGLVIGICDSYGVDARGRVWLAADGGADAWARFLAELDIEECRAAAAAAARVRALEAAAAAALGVATVHTEPRLAADAAHREFLEEAAAAAALLPPGLRAGRPLGDVAVVAHADAAASVAAAGPGARADGAGADAAGVVHVPRALRAPALAAALAALGPRAAEAAAAARATERALEDLRRQAERALRLRALRRGAGLPADRFVAACRRLIQHKAAAGPLLDGLEVEVGEANALPADRGHLIIAWNFEL